MRKPNGRTIKVDPLFHETMKEISTTRGASIMELSRQLGKQLQHDIRNNRRKYEIPPIKWPKISLEKRGSITDVFFVLAITFFLAMGFVLANSMWVEVKPKFSSMVNESEHAVTIVDKIDKLTSMLDSIFLIFLVLIVIGIIIISFTVNTHPVFYFFFVLVLIFGMTVAGIFSNAFEKFIDAPKINETGFAVTTYVMDNLVIILLVMGLVALIAIYAKVRLVG